MALESPLKKDIEKASRDLDTLHRLYNVYFGGGQDDPPQNERQALDKLITKIKTQVMSSPNSADRFSANTLTSKYQLFAAKWDKTLRGIESGTVILPKKRK